MSQQQTCKVFRGSPDGTIVNDEIQREMQPDDVLVEITHSSLCGTDQYYCKAPQVLGHEGIGFVREVGSNVKAFKAGDRVGMHYRQEICSECQDCRYGWDQFCSDKKDYGKSNPDQGTFASTMTWNASTLVRIPEACESANAATLMCSGATAWTALACTGLKPGAKVGIMSIGGLGHLAVKIAVALGYHVVALSSSEKKRSDCEKWGAHEYIVHEMGSPSVVDGSLDALLLCGHITMDFSKILPLMANRGTIYILTVDFENSPVPSLALIDRGLTISGTHVASMPAMHDMLQFCAAKGITADIEKFPFTVEGLDNAFKAMDEGRIRYKAVLCRDG